MPSRTMEDRLQSPLTQQSRPEIFKPKVVEFYEAICSGDADPTEGFWREFFLLRPEQKSLQRVLYSIQPIDLLTPELQALTRQLFARAISFIEKGESPSDENALDTLTIFLESVLSKKYPHPGSDIIEILAGLDDIDHVFADFTNALDASIRRGRTLSVRQKAVRAGLAAVAGAYSTGLVTYFVNRDLFPSFIQLIQDADSHHRAFGSLALLGLLVNYNKFEFQNPYVLRLQDFVSAPVMNAIATTLGEVFQECRDEYLSIQPDQTPTWTLGGALSSLKIGLTGSAPIGTGQGLAEGQVKTGLAEQPLPEACILLTLYDLVQTNRLFSSIFVTCRHNEVHPPKRPFVAFLSFVSYALQNAHRSHRSSVYARHMVQILQILLEDSSVAKDLFSLEHGAQVQLARQRQPFLPTASGLRPLGLAVLDVSIDGINHNLKRRLDVDLYVLLLGLQLRILTFCSRTRMKLVYHWSELWRSLLSFVRFLNTHVETLKSIVDIELVTGLVIQILALSLGTGEAFLPDAKSFDDLFYKIFESGEALGKFGELFAMHESKQGPALAMLTNASSHFNALLEEEKTKGKKHLSPREVTKMIKLGYDGLAIQAVPGLDEWATYREGDHRNATKTIARTAVLDVRVLLSRRPF